MAKRIFVIVGAPWTGKSLLLQLIRDKMTESFNAETITKVSTRRKRSQEGKEIAPVDNVTCIEIKATPSLLAFLKNDKYKAYYSYDIDKMELKLVGPMPYEELVLLYDCIEDDHREKINLQALYRRANDIGTDCDIIYEQYTKRYGFSINDIVKTINNQQNAIIIINDIRAIKELKSAFGELVVVILLYRPIPIDFEKIQSIERNSKDTLQTKRRREKAELITRRYFENIETFDHVILNTEDNSQDLISQINGIGLHYKNIDHIQFKATNGLYR